MEYILYQSPVRKSWIMVVLFGLWAIQALLIILRIFIIEFRDSPLRWLPLLIVCSILLFFLLRVLVWQLFGTRTIGYTASYLQVSSRSPFSKNVKSFHFDEIEELEMVDRGNRNGPFGALRLLGVLDRYFIRIRSGKGWENIYSDMNRVNVENVYSELKSVTLK